MLLTKPLILGSSLLVLVPGDNVRLYLLDQHGNKIMDRSVLEAYRGQAPSLGLHVQPGQLPPDAGAVRWVYGSMQNLQLPVDQWHLHRDMSFFVLGNVALVGPAVEG